MLKETRELDPRKRESRVRLLMALDRVKEVGGTAASRSEYKERALSPLEVTKLRESLRLLEKTRVSIGRTQLAYDEGILGLLRNRQASEVFSKNGVTSMNTFLLSSLEDLEEKLLEFGFRMPLALRILHDVAR